MALALLERAQDPFAGVIVGGRPRRGKAPRGRAWAVKGTST